MLVDVFDIVVFFIFGFESVDVIVCCGMFVEVDDCISEVIEYIL